MYYTYVLRSEKSGRFYTGATNDLRKRFSLHNTGKSFFTKQEKPYELIYYEACITKEDAFAREKYLKSGMGKRFIKNRLKRFLSLTG
jgi:putative endonuclease